VSKVHSREKETKVMGKATCKENQGFSEAIDLNDKAAKALRWAKTRTQSDPRERVLSDAISAYQEAIVALVGMQKNHQQGCHECQKGD
jgi:hypothetical protein